MINIVELLNSNVEGLTDDQKGKVEKLFQNALSERIAEIHRSYDQDIAAATGKTKPDGVKTYEWMKSEFAALKEAADKTAQAANEAAAAKIAQLESQLEKAKKGEGANAEAEQLRKELQDAKQVADQLRAQAKKEATAWEEKYGTLQQQHRQAEIKQHLVGLKFREDIPESLRELAVKNAVGYVAGLASETDSSGNTIYRDGEGKLITNPENSLAPFTTAELLQKQLADVIDKGRQQSGAGTKDSKPGQGKATSFVLNAQTQAEAMQQIQEHLFATGVPQTDPNHQEFIDTAWKDNNVATLPVR